MRERQVIIGEDLTMTSKAIMMSNLKLKNADIDPTMLITDSIFSLDNMVIPDTILKDLNNIGLHYFHLTSYDDKDHNFGKFLLCFHNVDYYYDPTLKSKNYIMFTKYILRLPIFIFKKYTLEEQEEDGIDLNISLDYNFENKKTDSMYLKDKHVRLTRKDIFFTSMSLVASLINFGYLNEDTRYVLSYKKE